MVAKTEHYEYGYRLADGTEVWEFEHGSDGRWISSGSILNLPVVDLYEGSEVAAIYLMLERAGVGGVALRRLVRTTTVGPEIVDRPTSI